LEASALKKLRDSKSKLEPEKVKTTKSCFCTPSICVKKQKSEKIHKETEKSIRTRIRKDADENPRIFALLLLKLAKKLVRENTISIPRISWKDYREHEASRTKFNPVQSDESESPVHLDSDNSELLSSYAIHPDLEDFQEWGRWIYWQTLMGNLLMTIPDAWKTLNKRKALGNKAFNRIGFLFNAYRVNYWYWEMLEMFRK
jgi:hypothetical protein